MRLLLVVIDAGERELQTT